MNRILFLLVALLPLRSVAVEQATAVAKVTAGSVTGITVTSAGSGYTSKPAVTINGGGGGGAAAKAILNGDKVASVIVLDAGSGYSSAPTIVIGTKSLSASMALVPGGAFQMGDSFGEGRYSELPVHTVTVSAFYMDKYEVTKALWDDVKGWSVGNGYVLGHPGLGKATNHPVHSVNWYDVLKWCNARSQKDRRVPAYYTDAAMTQVYKTGVMKLYVKWNAGYRLPTEAEWEKAARGGSSGQRFPWSDADTITHSRANYSSSSVHSYDIGTTRRFHPTYAVDGEPYTSPVGSFEANGYGLYDMAGNVCEWCWDSFTFGSYSNASQTDPRGPDPRSNRVTRGGSWNSNAFNCRTADRSINDPTGWDDRIGFRSVLPTGQ